MNNDFSIQLRGLNEIVFCEKLFHLMYAQGIFYDNADTLTGTLNHKMRENNSRKHFIEGADIFSTTLYAMDGHLSGKLDGVIVENGEYIPIEDKNSKKPSMPFKTTLWGVDIISDVWINDFPQIVGQIYLLRHNGYYCNHGKVYYRGSNLMIDVPYLESYDKLIENGVKYCEKIITSSEPKPLIDSDKCIRCSLNWVCLPDETNNIENNTKETRRLYPGRSDKSILYVTCPGGKIGKSGETITIWSPSKESTSIPLKDIEHVCIFGNVQITTQALHALIKNYSSIFYFTTSGTYIAETSASITKNIFCRKAQFIRFNNPLFCSHLTKKIVYAKISNQRTLLRRNKKNDLKTDLTTLKYYRDKIKTTEDIDIIRGYEGHSSKIFWASYPSLFKYPNQWIMNGRNRRPPKDEINSMLSYGYALLLRDFITAINITGLDHLLGFYHSTVPGRPALALDLMEPYRPLIIDSLVLRLINENIVSKKDFATTQSGVFINPSAKKKIIKMYENRMNEMITHPQFGYRLSYRRMIQLEVKILSKYITGEISDYFPLTTR